MATRDRKEPEEITQRAPTTAARSTRDSYPRSMDPFSQFRRLTDQMERWFEGVAGTRGGRSTDLSLWAPEIETFVRDNQFVVRADIPGLSKDEVNVEVTDDSIVIHGERQKTHEEEREGFYRSERTYGRFYREIPLPEGALPETAQAQVHDGVLEITVTAPPREVTRPRRVEIRGTSSTAQSQQDVGKTPTK